MRSRRLWADDDSPKKERKEPADKTTKGETKTTNYTTPMTK
jgi:hypothetical protein